MFSCASAVELPLADLIITLVRHGPTSVPSSERIPASALGRFVATVDSAGIASVPAPPPSLRAEAAAAGAVASSDLRRAIESARALVPTRALVTDAIFREAPLPTTLRGPVRLRPAHWSLVSRILWYLGWSGGGESLAAARERAGLAASRLAELARANGSVILIAHGVMNALIARQLRRCGWSGPRIPGSRHWASTRYSRAA